jgi:hypothetical protein
VTVFVRKDGSKFMLSCVQTLAYVVSNAVLEVKNTVNIVSSVMWRPFDVRLADLLDRITFHQQLVRDELNIAQAYAMNSLLEAANQERELEAKKEQEENRSQKQAEEIEKLASDIIKSMEQKHEGNGYPTADQLRSPC